MKVLQVCAYAAPYEGNFIKSLKSVGAALKKAGHKMIYAFPETAKKIDWCQELAKNTTVYYLPLARARIKPSTYRAIRDIFKEHPDIAIAHSHFELYDVPLTMTAPKNVRVFWHLHDAIENEKGLKNRIEYRLQYGLFHKKSTLLSVSEKHRDYTLRLGFPKEQANYIPNGLDTDRIKLVSTEVSSRPYDFLIFGWDYERKGVDLCVKAIRQCKQSVRVAIVGKDGTAERIKAEFGDVPGAEVVQPVTDINTLYAQSKCFLHISRAEGLSYALLEAIYAGLPIICSDIKENLFAERFPTVCMIPNENVEKIAEAMDTLVLHPSISAERVEKSRNIIDKEYSIACWTERILAAYGIEA